VIRTPTSQKIRARINKMELHQIKKFLHIKGNNCQNQEATQRMGENLYSTDKGLMSRIYK
jgi:hypothetical protein